MHLARAYTTAHRQELGVCQKRANSYHLHKYVAIIVIFLRSYAFDECFGFFTFPETMRWCHSSLLHLLCCLRLRVCARKCRVRPPVLLRELWAYVKLVLQSLQYNSLTNSDVVFDSVFEPVFWTVDRITRWFGMVFVCLVVVLTSSILLICYTILLPLVISTYSPGWVVWHLCYGHWNLVMIVFHYYKATKTAPGYPPIVKNDIPFVSVCKKCIIPKPARTHHCGICNRCILKMDHHCPWLNNCVGHLNQRYFFCFCLAMALGCMYCSISGRNLFLDAYNTLERFKHMDGERPGVPVTGMGLLIGILPSGQTNYQTASPPYTFRDRMVHKSIIYMWVLTSTVGVALGGLTIWHAVLISRGETSIERHINFKETKRLAKRGKVYKNPFNYGKFNNWKVFLGVQKKSHWLTRVILPSGHAPPGDGLTWDIFPFKRDTIPV